MTADISQSCEILPDSESASVSLLLSTQTNASSFEACEWRYDSSDKQGFAKLEGNIGDIAFECTIKTLLCVVGRETGVEQTNEHYKQFSGYHYYEMLKNELVSVNIFRPSGLRSFNETPWHPLDLTRIGFGSFKKLSRTHFSISWNSRRQHWILVCLSGNGVTVNDKCKLKENEELVIRQGDSIGAANSTVKLYFFPAS